MSAHAKSAHRLPFESIIVLVSWLANSAHRLNFEYAWALVSWVANSAHRCSVDVFELPGLKLLTPRYGHMRRYRVAGSRWRVTKVWTRWDLETVRNEQVEAHSRYLHLTRPSGVDRHGRRLAAGSRPLPENVTFRGTVTGRSGDRLSMIISGSGAASQVTSPSGEWITG